MPIDQQKFKSGQGFGGNNRQPKAQEASTITVQETNQQIAAGLRSTLTEQSGLISQVDDQIELITDHNAERLAAVLNPDRVHARFAEKTVRLIGGADYTIPFAVPSLSHQLPPIPKIPKSLRSDRALPLAN